MVTDGVTGKAVKVIQREGRYASPTQNLRDALHSGPGYYDLSVALKAVSQPDMMCGVVRIEDDAGPKWIATAETEVTAAGFKTVSVRSDARWTGTLKSAEIYLSSQSNADVIVDNLSFIKLPATELARDAVLGAGAGFIEFDCLSCVVP